MLGYMIFRQPVTLCYSVLKHYIDLHPFTAQNSQLNILPQIQGINFVENII